MEDLLAAIVEDDRGSVAAFLGVDPTLATRQVAEPKLYDSDFTHWLYARDTALHLAAAGYRDEIARLLLAAGADPDSARNHRRSTPLHYASDGMPGGSSWNPTRQVATIQCLLESGASVDAQDANGATPLHRAVRTRCAAATRCLLSSGGDPTSRNRSGSTPLHLAVQNTGRGSTGSEEARSAQRQIIQEFLARGVDLQLKDGRGRTVLDCARSDRVRALLSNA